MIFQRKQFELKKKSITTLHQTKDVENLHRNQASTDMTLNEFRILTITCWNEKNPNLTVDLSK